MRTHPEYLYPGYTFCIEGEAYLTEPSDDDNTCNGCIFDDRMELCRYGDRPPGCGAGFIFTKMMKSDVEGGVDLAKTGADTSATGTSQPHSILDEADAIIYGDREQTYGNPGINLQRIARFWTAHILGRMESLKPGEAFELTAEDVAWMMVNLKQSRQIHKAKRDNLVDAVGYVALIERLDAPHA